MDLATDYTNGFFMILGIIFLFLIAVYLVRHLILSTRKEMCTLDRKEVRRIARDETQGEMNTKMRELKKRENDIIKARKLLREERDLATD